LALSDGTALAPPTNFNIPPQPLSSALVAYGETTGLNIYYNAALAKERRSAAVTGVFTPAFALQMLLQGTGLVPQASGPDSYIIVPELPDAPPSMTTAGATDDSDEPYFAAIQERVMEVLCQNTGVAQAHGEIFFRIWLDSSGAISRAQVFDDAVDQAKGILLQSAMQGLAIGQPPPRGMAQPVTLVIFPPSSASNGCASAGESQEAN
jgi:hypothetical protein